jgi:hypothetical protein
VIVYEPSLMRGIPVPGHTCTGIQTRADKARPVNEPSGRSESFSDHEWLSSYTRLPGHRKNHRTVTRLRRSGTFVYCRVFGHLHRMITIRFSRDEYTGQCLSVVYPTAAIQSRSSVSIAGLRNLRFEEAAAWREKIASWCIVAEESFTTNLAN